MPQEPKKSPSAESTLQDSARHALGSLRPLAEKLRRSDPLLADQLMRAATHVAAEMVNAERAHPHGRRTHLLGGLAATSEAMTLLRVAVDSRHCRWDTAKDTYYELSHTYLELIKRVATKRRGIAKKPRDGKRRAA